EKVSRHTRLSEPANFDKSPQPGRSALTIKNEKSAQVTWKSPRQAQETSRAFDKSPLGQSEKISRTPRPRSPSATRMDVPLNGIEETNPDALQDTELSALPFGREKSELDTSNLKAGSPLQSKATLPHSTSRSSVEETRARLDASKRRS